MNIRPITSIRQRNDKFLKLDCYMRNRHYTFDHTSPSLLPLIRSNRTIRVTSRNVAMSMSALGHEQIAQRPYRYDRVHVPLPSPESFTDEHVQRFRDVG